MDRPLQLTFHNLSHSDAVEQDVRDRVEKLDSIYDHLTGCRVVIDSPHRNQNRSKTFAVRIEMAVPGQELVVSREPIGDLQSAINDAFETAKRRLRTYVQKQRRD